jgi:hypothetical protein
MGAVQSAHQAEFIGALSCRKGHNIQCYDSTQASHPKVLAKEPCRQAGIATMRISAASIFKLSLKKSTAIRWESYRVVATCEREMSPFNKSDWLYRPPADIHRPILKTSCHYICFVNGGHAAEFGGVGFGYSMVRVIDVQDPDARLQGDSN